MVLLFIFQQMDALDQSEELTELGRHLADLPVDPHLGKMVLNSIVLKCLDPVLTIVCSLSYKDPCKYYLTPCMLGSFSGFCCHLLIFFFSILTFSKNSFRKAIRV